MTSVVEDVEDIEARLDGELLLDSNWARYTRVEIDQILEGPWIGLRYQRDWLDRSSECAELRFREEASGYQRLPGGRELAGKIVIEVSEDLVELLETLDLPPEVTNVRARQQIARAPVTVDVGCEDAAGRGEAVQEWRRQVGAGRREEAPELIEAEPKWHCHQRAGGKDVRAVVAGRAVRAVDVVVEGCAAFKFEAVLAVSGGGP